MSVLKQPLITEKANQLNEDSKFSFIVDKKANKVQIKKAIEEAYGVSVEDVRTMNYKGKPKYRYTKSRIISGRSDSYKKAIVKLADGEIIDFYSDI